MCEREEREREREREGQREWVASSHLRDKRQINFQAVNLSLIGWTLATVRFIWAYIVSLTTGFPRYPQ